MDISSYYKHYIYRYTLSIIFFFDYGATLLHQYLNFKTMIRVSIYVVLTLHLLADALAAAPCLIIRFTLSFDFVIFYIFFFFSLSNQLYFIYPFLSIYFSNYVTRFNNILHDTVYKRIWLIAIPWIALKHTLFSYSHEAKNIIMLHLRPTNVKCR